MIHYNRICMLSQNIPYIYEIYNNGINDLGKERLLFLEYSPCSDEKNPKTIPGKSRFLSPASPAFSGDFLGIILRHFGCRVADMSHPSDIIHRYSAPLIQYIDEFGRRSLSWCIKYR